MGRNLLAEPDVSTSTTTETSQVNNATNQQVPSGRNLLEDTGSARNLLDEPKPKKTAIDRLKSFGEEALFGTAIGAITPELTMGAGAAAAAFPLTAPAAPYLMMTGRAMQMARPAAAGAGFLSGVGGEAGAQIAEAYGKPEKTQELVRLAAGAVTPEFGNLIKYAAGKALKATGIATTSDLASVANSISKDLGLEEKTLSPAQKNYIQRVIQDIRGGVKTDEPLKAVYTALEKGAEKIVDKYNSAAQTLERQAQRLLEGKDAGTRVYALADELSTGAQALANSAKDRANAILRNAESRAAAINAEAGVEGGRSVQMAGIDAQDVLARGKQQADQVLRESQERVARLRQVAENARTSGGKRLSEAGGALTEVGTPQLPTQTGTSIRDKVLPFFNKLKETRSANAEQLKGEAFNYAALKEQQGSKVKDTKAFTEATDELNRDINTATLGAIKEPLKNILRALDPKFTDEKTGVVTGKDVTFEGLEFVRRFLRDRSYGLPAEGFDAINQQMAGKLANAVEKIQLEFSPSMEKFLKQYADDSQPLTQFKTRLGKAIVGAEEFDMGRFVTDPADIGTKFFKTETGVKDLTNLLGGDVAGAESIARGFVLDKLRDPSAKKIQSFLEGPARDWIDQFPALKTQLQEAAQRLGGAETVSQKRSTLSDTLRTEATSLFAKAPKVASKAMSDAQEQAAKLQAQGRTTEAKLIMDAAEKAEREVSRGGEKASRLLSTAATKLSDEGGRISDLILNKSFDARRAQEIILSGDRKLWSEVGPIINENPEAKKAFADAVRQVLADKAGSSPKSILDTFNKDVRPAIEQTGLMSPQQMTMLQKQLENINKTASELQKPKLLQRAITNTLTGQAATGLSSITDPFGSLYDILKKK